MRSANETTLDNCPVVWHLRVMVKYCYLPTYLTPLSSPSCEANRFSASQDIPHILWNLKVHYCSHKCPPAVPIL